MDYYAMAIFLTTIMFVLEIYIQWRQNSVHKIKKPPAHLQGYVTQEKFSTAQNYNLDKSNFRIAKIFFEFLTSIYFFRNVHRFYLASKELAFSLRSEDSVFHSHGLLTAAILAASLIVVLQVIDIPFDIYYNFILEEAHGFNKMTVLLYVTDSVKTLFLKLFIGVPLLLAFLFIVEFMGPSFPIIAWAFMVIVKVVLMLLYPYLIQPCFNRISILQEGKLKLGIESLAEAVEYPMKKIFTIDGSVRSNHSNAYMYGCCGQKYIVLYDTLLKQCSEQQIIAILGHELGHWKKSHIIKMFIVLEAFMFSTFYAMRLFLFSDDLYTSFGFTENPVIIGTFLFFVLYEPIEQIRSVLFNGYMRYLENEADDFSSDLGYSEHLVEGLLALERENKSGLITDPIYSLFKHNHPPIIERVRRLRLKMNKEL